MEPNTYFGDLHTILYFMNDTRHVGCCDRLLPQTRGARAVLAQLCECTVILRQEPPHFLGAQGPDLSTSKTDPAHP